MRSLLSALLATAALAAHAPAQNPHVTAVENGLLPTVRIRGRTQPMRLAERMAFWKVPGVSIAIIDGGRIAWAKGYGVREAGDTTPVDTATLFQAASLSKPVAAAGALQLVRQGRVTLDGDVNTWLRSWKVPENAFTRQHPVTLAGIMSHTAGFTVHGFPGYDVDSAVPTVVRILDGVRPANTDSVRVHDVPGHAFSYSGGGFTVLQQLVIDVTGQPFPAFMQRAVLQPLGMRHSTYEQPLPGRLARDAASAHDGAGRVLHGKWHVYPEMAAAGLWTTPSDLARFALAVQGAAAGRANGVFTPELVAEMLTSRSDASYGLGIGLSGTGAERRFVHDGSNAGFRCALQAYVSRGQGAVVMTNGANGSQLADEILRAIAAEYGWPGFLRPEVDVVELAPQVLDGWVGAYRLADGTAVTVTREGAALYGQAAGEPRIRLWPTSDSTFVLGDTGNDVRVERDSTRAVTGLVILRPGRQDRVVRVR